MYLVRNGIPSLIQVPVANERDSSVNDEIWTRYALGDSEPASAPAGAYRPRLPRAALPPAPDAEQPALTSEPAVLIGLAEAARYLGMSYNALKIARKRMPGGKIPGEFVTRWKGRDKPAFHRDSLSLWRWGSVTGVSDGGRQETGQQPPRTTV
jgi:hypothetical protein